MGTVILTCLSSIDDCTFSSSRNGLENTEDEPDPLSSTRLNGPGNLAFPAVVLGLPSPSLSLFEPLLALLDSSPDPEESDSDEP